ncbi:MAG: hypothetical protein L0Y61_02780 [Epsilonproteobacteria bacterium]|nr:hypothetical protein [Campylobacterota bacterium]
MKQSTLIFVVLILAFFGFGIMTFKDAMPNNKKEERIYNLLSKHFPYTIEKRLGGFTIVFKDSNEKVKPTNSEFYSKIASIDKFWGKEHLLLKSNSIAVIDVNKTLIDEIKFETTKEKEFVQTYFDLKEITKEDR